MSTEKAAALKQRARKIITLPTVTMPDGSPYTVTMRRVNQLEFIERGGSSLLAVWVPDVVPGAKPHKEHSLEDRAAFTRKLMGLSITDPLIWTGDPAICPETHVTLDDFGDDFAYVMKHCLNLHGITGGAAQAADSFRQEVGRNAGSDSAPLPDGPDPAAPADDVGADVVHRDLPRGDEGGGGPAVGVHAQPEGEERPHDSA